LKSFNADVSQRNEKKEVYSCTGHPVFIILLEKGSKLTHG
jgi:hypothetical protein